MLALFWYLGMSCYGGLSRWTKLSADFCIELWLLRVLNQERDMERGAVSVNANVSSSRVWQQLSSLQRWSLWLVESLLISALCCLKDFLHSSNGQGTERKQLIAFLSLLGKVLLLIKDKNTHSILPSL